MDALLDEPRVPFSRRGDGAERTDCAGRGLDGDRLRTLKSLLRFGTSTPRGRLGVAAAAGGGSAALAGDNGCVVVASIQSLLQPAPPCACAGGWLALAPRGRVDRCGVARCRRWLVEQRFHNTSAVELPGEFSVRGGIIDVFAPDWQQPVRVELWGDQFF